MSITEWSETQLASLRSSPLSETQLDDLTEAAIRDAVKVNIRDFLYNDATGLPMSYNEDEITRKADIVYVHIFDSYRDARSSVYDNDVG